MASHFNPLAEGEERKVHSHPYSVVMTVSGEELDENGLLLDVTLMQRAMDRAWLGLKGKVLNELPEFERTFPSIESLAQVIWYKVVVDLDPSRIEWLEVTVWEDKDISASFKEKVPSGT